MFHEPILALHAARQLHSCGGVLGPTAQHANMPHPRSCRPSAVAPWSFSPLPARVPGVHDRQVRLRLKGEALPLACCAGAGAAIAVAAAAWDLGLIGPAVPQSSPALLLAPHPARPVPGWGLLVPVPPTPPLGRGGSRWTVSGGRGLPIQLRYHARKRARRIGLTFSTLCLEGKPSWLKPSTLYCTATLA